MRNLSVAAVVSLALGASPAAAFLASNGLIVEPRGQEFNVPYRGESGARAFWCAAAEYARGPLGLSPTTKIYRTSEPPRRSGQGIAFSLSPSNSASRTGLAIFGNVGGGISVGHGLSLCDDRLLNFD